MKDNLDKRITQEDNVKTFSYDGKPSKADVFCAFAMIGAGVMAFLIVLISIYLYA